MWRDLWKDSRQDLWDLERRVCLGRTDRQGQARDVGVACGIPGILKCCVWRAGVGAVSLPSRMSRVACPTLTSFYSRHELQFYSSCWACCSSSSQAPNGLSSQLVPKTCNLWCRAIKSSRWVAWKSWIPGRETREAGGRASGPLAPLCLERRTECTSPACRICHRHRAIGTARGAPSQRSPCQGSQPQPELLWRVSTDTHLHDTERFGVPPKRIVDASLLSLRPLCPLQRKIQFRWSQGAVLVASC